MQRELEQLADGRLTFDGFARATRLEWFRLASYLLRRWQAPADVGLEDLVQEMLLEAWRISDRFDPRRGKTIQQYVTWNAVTRAKKWLHRRATRCAWRRSTTTRPAGSSPRRRPSRLRRPGRARWRRPCRGWTATWTARCC